MKKENRLLILIVVILLLGSIIAFPIFGVRLIYSATPESKRAVITPPPGSTPTATAFQPSSPTETYIPTAYPTSTPTITPTPKPTKPASRYPAGARPIAEPEGQVNIVILGSDQHANSAGFRTDVIMLLTVNTKLDTVNITSFPRDLYVFIPGWTNQRINTAFPKGGFKTLKNTFEYNFGFQPDYYVLVNLWLFERVINDLGGIYVNVPYTLCDNKWNGAQHHCVYPGKRHMYGKEALWYVRSRQTTSDFDRNRRQQQVVQAVFQRALALNTLGKIPKFYNTYKNSVQMNIPLKTILSFLPTATKLKDTSRINQYYIDKKAVSSWVTSGGAQVLLPRSGKIRSILKQALNSP